MKSQNCQAETIGREYAQLWRASNLANEKGDQSLEIEIHERIDHLDVQATYVPATSLNGALFQLGQASLWLGCVDGERKVDRLIASVAQLLVSMGGEANEWCDPTCTDRIQAAIADAAVPLAAVAARETEKMG